MQNTQNNKKIFFKIILKSFFVGSLYQSLLSLLYIPVIFYEFNNVTGFLEDVLNRREVITFSLFFKYFPLTVYFGIFLSVLSLMINYWLIKRYLKEKGAEQHTNLNFAILLIVLIVMGVLSWYSDSLH